MTTDPTDLPLFRILVEPNDSNGLSADSRVIVDEITTVRRTRLTTRIGRLSDTGLMRVGRAVVVFLGLAQPSRADA
ncbi:MAG TPA: type II toxin-antitoxin system PemK/MazF family toxin [Dehalococcoidia bacterium]|nr:type II toxin-antitoxin system PemK/MazF family toxin [Dehalococcoidia bacterium]